MTEFTHLNKAGEANMVDVSSKSITQRLAIAEAKVLMSPELMTQVRDQSIAKGDLMATARIAGIQAAKRCSELIPLCHPLPLNKVSIEIEEIDEKSESECGLVITSLCKTSGITGVEMEALTAASIAALTIYDMCKGIDKGMIISSVKLLKKEGGKSGVWQRSETARELSDD